MGITLIMIDNGWVFWGEGRGAGELPTLLLPKSNNWPTLIFTRDYHILSTAQVISSPTL